MSNAFPKYEYYAGGMTMGEVFDQSIRLYRRNFFTLVGILMRVYVPLMVLRILVEIASNSSIVSSEPMIKWYTTLLLSLALVAPKFVQTFLSMGLTAIPMARAVGSLWLGVPIRVRDAYRRVFPLWRSWLGTMGLLGIILVLMLLWTVIPVVGWLSGPALLLVLCLVIPPMLGPLIAFERKSGWSAIKRTWDLVRPRFWWLLTVLIAMYALGRWLLTGPLLTAEMVFAFISDGSLNPDWILPSLRILTALVTMLADLLFLPLGMTMMTLIYLDHRMRVDGLDLALHVDASSSPLDVLEKFPAPDTPLHLDRRDRINLSALSALVIGAGYLAYVYPQVVTMALFLLSVFGLI